MKLIIFTLFLTLLTQANPKAQTVPYSESVMEWVWDRNTTYNSTFQSQYYRATANDNCANATVINVGDPCTNGTTATNTVETGEAANFPCNPIGGGGVTPRSSWYRFNTGTLTELNFSINRPGVGTNCGYHVAIYGPFTPGAGCLPTAAQSVYCEELLDLYDPGFHFQLTTLSQNSDYLIQIMNEDCGGSNNRTIDYCIRIQEPPLNNTPSTATIIDQCGVVFNGTNIGYSPTNGLPGNENLDNNAATQCPSCATAGEDVTYVVNNDSWFYFCATTAGVWNIDFTNISNCAQGTTSGLQMSIFRGTPTNLTLIEDAPSPSAPGSTWTSTNFSVSAGECIYMIVDGFAGDECDYSYTLNNVSGGCVLVLSSDLIRFHGENTNNINKIYWEITNADGEQYQLQKSKDAINWSTLEQYIASNDDYKYTDVSNGTTYYRLNGGINSDIIALSSKFNLSYQPEKYFAPNGVLIHDIERYRGLYIIMYSNGFYEKRVKN